MLIIQSQSMDVYRNLAIEEYLMEHALDHGPVLFLWQSDCAVVMGKNQNPWRECRLDMMQSEGVPLARRISGGGTVYHDTGNLNYCVIVDRRIYREQQAYDMVVRALATFGITAEKTGKSNLSVGERKVSGNAFCFRRGRALHHGTLLLHTDLARLNRYLGSMLQGIETHAIASVPAHVENLNIAVSEVSAALIDSFGRTYGNGGMVRWDECDLEQQTLDRLLSRHSSRDWLYGATPKFTFKVRELEFEVVKGNVVHAAGTPDYMGWQGKDFSEIAFSLLC